MLFAAFATVAKEHMGDFNVQVLANTAWAFAKVGQNDASQFAALATAAEQHMGDFNEQNLANTAWAFATVDQMHALLFVALATVLPFSVAWATSWNPRLPVPPFLTMFFNHFLRSDFIGFW